MLQLIHTSLLKHRFLYGVQKYDRRPWASIIIVAWFISAVKYSLETHSFDQIDLSENCKEYESC